MLTLDHLIIRTGDPAATLAVLAERGGFPVLAEPTPVGGLTSGIVNAGAVDIEVLGIGEDPPDAPRGYGLGFVADRPMAAALSALRAAGVPTSVPISASAGTGSERRRFSATQVGGLLPDPFPVAMSTRRPGARDRLSARVGSALTRIPAVARAATRAAGSSMVVVTEYGFDAVAHRASFPGGSEVVEVRVNASEHLDAWSRVPLAASPSVRIDDAQSAPLLQVTLAAGCGVTAEDFRCGDVSFTFA